MQWFTLDINPEPWAIGPVGYARRNGKMSAYVGRNQQLHSYKEAVREALGPQTMLKGDIRLRFFFWRNRAEYITPQARSHRKHEADLTNLQKATEDALQGVLFENDKDVADIHSTLVEQGPDVHGLIVIGIEADQALIEDVIELMPGSVQDKVEHLSKGFPAGSSDLYLQGEVPF